MATSIVEYFKQMEDESRVIARVQSTARELLEDTLRDGGYPALADLLKSDYDTLHEPKPILIAYNYDAYDIKYLSANYSEEIIALDSKYLMVDFVTEEEEEIIRELNDQEALETVDLSLYSRLVTIGWLN